MNPPVVTPTREMLTDDDDASFANKAVITVFVFHWFDPFVLLGNKNATKVTTENTTKVTKTQLR